jgi:hypothetical protein
MGGNYGSAPLRYILWTDPELANCTMSPKNHIYHDNQWFINRQKDYALACKAGCNNESHNHNDVGSFVLSKNGKVTLCDIGGGEYTRQYFGPERYTILCNSSRGHSVPIIDGEYQSHGSEAAARELTYDGAVFSLDIAGAYSNLGEGEKIYRSFALGDSSVTLTDKFLFNKERGVTERFITRFEPDISVSGTVKVEEATLKYDGERWSVSVEKLPLSAEGKFCYAIDLAPRGELCDFVCEIGVC